MACYILESSLGGQNGQEDLGRGLVQAELLAEVVKKAQIDLLRRPTWIDMVVQESVELVSSSSPGIWC